MQDQQIQKMMSHDEGVEKGTQFREDASSAPVRKGSSSDGYCLSILRWVIGTEGRWPLCSRRCMNTGDIGRGGRTEEMVPELALKVVA